MTKPLTEIAQQYINREKMAEFARDALPLIRDSDDLIKTMYDLSVAACEAAQIEFQENTGTVRACFSGCGLCCRVRVEVTAIEAFIIAREIRGRERMTQKVHRLARALKDMDADTRFAAKEDCAALVHGKCAVYSKRPGACRGLSSVDWGACVEASKHDTVVPYIVGDMVGGLGMATLTLELARVGGCQMVAGELHHMVSIALSEPDAEQRWLTGGRVFA